MCYAVSLRVTAENNFKVSPFPTKAIFTSSGKKLAKHLKTLV